MIHRFLIFDRKFNCRLDRRYPLSQFAEFNSINSSNSAKHHPAAIPKLNVSQAETENVSIENESPRIGVSWNTLVIKSTDTAAADEEEIKMGSSGSLVSQLGKLELTAANTNFTANELLLEHSQQLILGMTHSLKNMLQKLSPINSQQQQQQVQAGLEGYSFSFKTSKYRLFYFESFTGWKLIMISDCNAGITGNNTTNTTTPDSVLKSFYTQILLKFLSTYPLGTVYTAEKSTESRKVIVKDDFLHRPGFLSKMDEFIHDNDRYF